MIAYDGCNKCAYVAESDQGQHCGRCIHNCTDQFKPMTNADKIRAMTDDELADFLHKCFLCKYGCPVKNDCGNHYVSCENATFHWLQKESEE